MGFDNRLVSTDRVCHQISHTHTPPGRPPGLGLINVFRLTNPYHFGQECAAKAKDGVDG